MMSCYQHVIGNAPLTKHGYYKTLSIRTQGRRRYCGGLQKTLMRTDINFCIFDIPSFLILVKKCICLFTLFVCLCCCDHFFSGSQKTSVMSKTRAWGHCRSSGPAFSADRIGTKTVIPIKMKTRK